MFLYLLVFVFAWLLYYFLTKSFNYWKDRQVCGPKPIPFFGNFKDVVLRKKHVGMLYNEMYKQYPDEKVVGLFRMTAPTLLIRDLDIAKQVLIKDFECFPDRATYYSKQGLGQNMFHCDLVTWKILRKRFTSVFTSSKFKSIFHLLVDRGDKFNNYIEDVTMKQPEQDVYNLMLKYTVSTIMVAGFGLDIDTFNDSRLFEIIDEEVKASFLSEVDIVFPGFLTQFNLSLLAKNTIQFCHEIVRTGISNQRLKTDIHNVMDVILSFKDKSDIYSTEKIKTDEKQPMVEVTDELLAAQAWVFYTAGNANNTLSLTYAMYHLARNPDVQEKLRQEIDEVLAKYDGKLTYEALKEMKYLDMAFEETLRMHPLTNGLVRSVAKDVRIEGIDATIDKDCIVVVSPYAIQHDEKYYPEPERFNPERFLPENIVDRHQCAFLPFGTGPRSCLGSQLARNQFGICVASLLSKFRVEPSNNTISCIQYDPWRMLLTPKERIRLNFIPRS
ncbi:cytochrome P450 6B1-like [Anticarsia gemmatalis]|uniref:cytochrome P450 6B1-like n=1 Tax=Anticarsia gemmatalis TaxID=129554 RepID=UPI003F77112F